MFSRTLLLLAVAAVFSVSASSVITSGYYTTSVTPYTVSLFIAANGSFTEAFYKPTVSPVAACVLHGQIFPVGTAVYWSIASSSPGCEIIFSSMQFVSGSYTAAGVLAMTVKSGSTSKVVTFAKVATPQTLPTGMFCSTTDAPATLIVSGTGVGATKRYRFAYGDSMGDFACGATGESLSGSAYPLTADNSVCSFSVYSIKVSGSVVTVSFGDEKGNQTIALSSSCAAKTPAAGTYCGTFAGASYSVTWNGDGTFSDTLSLISDAANPASMCSRSGLIGLSNGDVRLLSMTGSPGCDTVLPSLPIDGLIVTTTASSMTFTLTYKSKTTITMMKTANCGVPAAGLYTSTVALGSGSTAVLVGSVQNGGAFTYYLGTASTGITCFFQGMFVMGDSANPRVNVAQQTCDSDSRWGSLVVNGFVYTSSSKTLQVLSTLAGRVFNATLK